MPVHREEEQGRDDHQELAEHRILLARGRIDHRREAEAHRVADHLAGDERAGKADLDREADGEPGHDLADHQQRSPPW